jgi:hypothetical protein
MGRISPCQKFSNISLSALASFLHTITIELTFDHFNLEASNSAGEFVLVYPEAQLQKFSQISWKISWHIPIAN